MPLTPCQQEAIHARGNVIVVAGAGTGKTSTLVERCLDVIREGSSLDRILMVTFTESAAAEMRHRLRVRLEELVGNPGTEAGADRVAEQLALVETAKISTIHSFCLRLVKSHFHELALDPEVKVLDDPQCRLLTQETLDGLFEDCFGGKLNISEEVQALVTEYAPDRDKVIRDLVLKLHRYTQSLPNPAQWIARQQAACVAEPTEEWAGQLVEAFVRWRDEWRSALEEQSGFDVIDNCLKALAGAGETPDRSSVRTATEGVLAADDGDWKKQKTKRRKPFTKFFDEAAFLASVSAEGALETDGQAVRGHLNALLALTVEFTNRFTAAKRELGGVDFPDLEQLALRLLLDEDGTPSAVAAEWQERIDFVFVDESQDINGAQDALLAAVSRAGAEANRFLVGDVKQSIYRFRLADPRIFRRYEAGWSGRQLKEERTEATTQSAGSDRGSVSRSRPSAAESAVAHRAARLETGSGIRITLTENFRSRPGILAFVNALFPTLMRESVGGVAYEPLQAGKEGPMAMLGGGPCVELHLIRKESRDDHSPETDGNSDTPNELLDLSATEREARLVASRLLELKRSRFVIWDKDEARRTEVEWGDMAILMRSPGPKTEVFAKVFHEYGIPLDAARAGFLDAIEVSDLVSLLKLLDNPLQDIPLLAVLRSPLVGLTLDELATIRGSNCAKPFWLALQGFAWDASFGAPGQAKTEDGNAGKGVPANAVQCVAGIPAGPRKDIRERASEFLAQVERWRELVRQVGPSLCLEQVLADTGYDILLGANERGAQQLANVRLLLDLARQFDPYLRQGLYRFLRFLRTLDEAEDSLEPAAPPARDAVRLMSIHKSKGLEFPVVVLAGLGTKFNFSDLRGLILLDEEFGLTAKAMTTDGAGRYPTLPFWMAERRQRAQTLAEELRLLYVAMTRARDRLICCGMLPRKDQGRWNTQEPAALSDHDLLSATQPLDWLLHWLPCVTKQNQWQSDAKGESSLMTWELWDPQDKRLQSRQTAEPSEVVPGSEPVAKPVTVEAVASRVSHVYLHAAASREPAKSSVSALRRRATEFADEDAFVRFPQWPSPRHVGASNSAHGLSAADRGTLHHRFLEQLAIEQAHDVAELAQQAKMLVQRNILTQTEADALDLNRIAAFWASDVGQAVRAQVAHARRELPFTVRLEDAELRAVLGQPPESGLSDEFVVVQGVADLVVVLEDELWLLDFKTDDVKGGALTTRAREYEPQLQLYAMALERIFHKPVRHRWLHFLSVSETVELA